MGVTGPIDSAPVGGWRRVGRALADFAWYPAELAAIFVLSIFLASGVSPFAMFRPLAIATGVALAITLVASLLLRSTGRGGIAAVLVELGLVVVGSTQMVALVLVAACLAIAFDRLPGRRLTWARVSRWLTAFATILLVIVVAQGVASGRVGVALEDVTAHAHATGPGTAAHAPGDAPDIYVFVLDSYARPDMLRSEFGLDVSPFLASLRARGFDVATDSRSDYSRTNFTLVSMLNMAPVDTIAGLSPAPADPVAVEEALRRAINDNVVFQRYRAMGYTVVATASGFEPVAIRGADVYLDDGQINSFELNLLGRSGAGAPIEALAPSFVGDQLRSRLDGTFRQLRTLAATASTTPRLVISHVLSPHPPALYGPNGEPRTVALDAILCFAGPTQDGPGTNRQAYADQVTYLDGRLSETIDAILAASARPPVIVVMSDHGSRVGAACETPDSSVESTDSFFAALTPGHPWLFGNSPTPLAVFGRLLAAYGGVGAGSAP